MKDKILVTLVGIAFLAFFQTSNISAAVDAAVSADAPATPPKCPVKLTLIELSPGPVLKQGDPGTEGNKFGVEGGCVFKHQGLYHFFTSEEMGDPYWVKMRLGHWTSPDRVKWTRSDTITESSGEQNGINLKAAPWAPMPFYDEQAKLWNMYYVAYRSKAKPGLNPGWYGNYDGRIVRAVSQTPGPNGLKGPWKDVEIALEPDWESWKKNGSQPWEGLQGVDSMSPPFSVGDKWLAFYGSCQTQGEKKNPAYTQWNVGLAEAPAATGPWTRCATGNPMPFQADGYCENPIATRLADNLYVMVCDRGTIGYAASSDGVHWSRAESVEIPEKMRWWTGRTTTPMGVIPESDGTYTIFFTAPNPKFRPEGKKAPWESLGFVRVKMEIVP